MVMNSVFHFEMPAENKNRMSEFYTKTFGWQCKQLGPDMGEYVLVMTTESDTKGPVKPGAINGGFFQKTSDPLTHTLSIVIKVDDLSTHMKKVKAGGGTVIGKPIDIPGVGTFVSFSDTEGNRLSMMQMFDQQKKK